ncbi:MAG: hypothetical protein ACE5LX_10350, partial [Nitrospinota bacterium]
RAFSSIPCLPFRHGERGLALFFGGVVGSQGEGFKNPQELPFYLPFASGAPLSKRGNGSLAHRKANRQGAHP